MKKGFLKKDFLKETEERGYTLLHSNILDLLRKYGKRRTRKH